MSCKWSLRCGSCLLEAGCINHGLEDWRIVLRDVWPLLKPLFLAERVLPILGTAEVEVRILGNSTPDSEVWDFLLEHEAHGVELVNEYGKVEER